MASLERRVAIDAARAAGHVLREALVGERRIAFKGTPTNLVTEMDTRAEALISERLRAAFPGDALLGEEGGATAGGSGRRWIVDPLDGTTNYAHGLPIFAVSIGLEIEGRPALGVVYDPNLDELFVAERGGGAWLGGQRLRVSATATLNESLLATGFPYNVRETADNNLAEFAAFTVRARAIRRMGSAVIYLAYIAAGRIDGYWELRLGAWDVAAGVVLVEEAGGTSRTSAAPSSTSMPRASSPPMVTSTTPCWPCSPRPDRAGGPRGSPRRRRRHVRASGQDQTAFGNGSPARSSSVSRSSGGTPMRSRNQ